MEFATRCRPLIAAVLVAIACVSLSSHATSSAPVAKVALAGVQDEAGDTIDRARKITVCTPQDHAFDELGDVDWLKFRAWADVRYTIETYDLSGINDTELRLYDADVTMLALNDDDPDRPPASRIDWIAPEDGTYYIKVAHPKGQGGSGFDYTVHLRARDPGVDTYEPDNTRDEAVPIEVDGDGQAHTFHGACGGDVDWVTFEAIAGARYTIRTSNLTGGNDTVLRLVDEDGNEKGFDDDSSDSYPASQFDWVADEGGTYFIEVTPFNPFGGGSEIGYNLEVVTSAMTRTPPIPPGGCADEFEPDDAPGEANPIAVNGGKQERTFHEAGDEDWVKFWAHAGNRYTIGTSGLDVGNDTYVCLYDADLREKACSDDIDPPFDLASRIVWLASESGTYYVKVRHDNPYVSGCLDYDLEVRSEVPCADDYEGDDTPQRAQPIDLGEPQDHNFHVACADRVAHEADEADWVTFEASEGVTYTIMTSDLGGSNDTVLELYDEGILYDPNHRPLETSDDYLDNLPASQIVWQAPDNDDYYVKVSPFDTRVGGCGVSYTLRVIPSADHVELEASPTELSAGGVETSLLEACVYDKDDVGLSDVTVHFTSTCGTLMPTVGTTGPSGCLTATLASVEPCTAVVTASVSPKQASVSVVFKSYIYVPLVLKSWPPNQPPNVPSAPSPGDGATGVDPVGLELSWDGGDPDLDDTVTYDVYFGTQSPGVFQESIGPFPATQGTTTYDPGDLRGGTTYNWSVVARDGSGLESEGASWSFRTKTCACQDPREPGDDDYYGAAVLDGIPFENDEATVEGYVCQGHLNENDEEWDFYWFLIPRAGAISVDLEVPDTVDYDLFLWDWDAEAFKTSEDPTRGADESIKHAATFSEPGLGYYWVVVKSTGDYDACNPYVLSVTYP